MSGGHMVAVARQDALVGPFLFLSAGRKTQGTPATPSGDSWSGSTQRITVESTFSTGLILLAAGEGGGSSGLFQILTLWLPIGFLFYWLLIRPQRREQATRRAMLRALKRNDRVITSGGIYGVVTNVHESADEVTVKVDEATNTKLRMTRGAISRVLTDESSGDK